jgi:hypothetical protein
MKKLLPGALLIIPLLYGCNSVPGDTPAETTIPVTISESDSFEDQVSAYIKNYPYQETYKYIQYYTGGSVEGLNVWFWPPEPSLTKSGDDKVVRMNNDTFYNGIVLDLGEGPIVLGTEAANDRFYAFQLQDDRNANYANIIQPEGEYTFYHGEKPANIVGKPVEAASELSIIIVRIEVKDKDDARDVAAATKVYKSLTSSGEQPTEYPVVDVLSQFSEEVAAEAEKRIADKFMNSEVPEIVLNFGQVVGQDISYLAHAAAAKGVWGGPDLNHSMYDTLFNDVNGEQLDSQKGTYTVTTEAPNVNGFWSVTAYDTDRGGFFHPNKDDRYHFNEATAATNSDGTYTFTFKQECQTADINCLEVPKGHFDVVARYYLPSEEIINREWIFPNLELQE